MTPAEAQAWRDDSDANARAFQEFWESVDVGEKNACWPWTAARSRAGYGVVSPSMHAVLGERAAHRIAAQHHWGSQQSKERGLLVLHSCDNPPCCNPRHLRWGTAIENQQDKSTALWCALALERRQAGEMAPSRWESMALPGPFSKNPITVDNPHHSATVSNETVRAIRDDFDSHITIKNIADVRGLNASLVHSIAHRHSWVHLR